MVCPTEQAGGFGGEQVDNRFFGVRQSGAGLLSIQVGRVAPESFFADEPDAVGEFVEEAALAFEILGDGEFPHTAAAGTVDGFVTGAVAVAAVLEKEGSGQRGPRLSELGLGGGNSGAACIIGNGLRWWGRGISTPGRGGDERGFDRGGSERGCKQALSGGRGFGRRDSQERRGSCGEPLSAGHWPNGSKTRGWRTG